MRPFFYKNIIVTLVFLLLPVYYLNVRYERGWPEFNYYFVFIFVIIGVGYLLLLNVKTLRTNKKKSRLLPVLFLLLPGAVAVYGILFILWWLFGSFGF